jgi:hypothetical protein
MESWDGSPNRPLLSHPEAVASAGDPTFSGPARADTEQHKRNRSEKHGKTPPQLVMKTH